MKNQTYQLMIFVDDNGELVSLEVTFANVPEAKEGLKNAVKDFASSNNLNVVAYQDRDSN